MEFSSRGFQRDNTRATATASTASTADSNAKNSPSSGKRLQKLKDNKHVSILAVILSISLLILVVAILLGISTKPSENAVVKDNRYQAVFLNGGQAYFGKITNLNDRYIDLSDIYYISTNGQTNAESTANISLVKLGSELHCPQDRMLINRDQVLFWENLNDDGKVVNAIKQWRKENPNGQKCNNQTTQQQTPASSENTSDQNTGTNNSATTPTSNTPTSSNPSTTGNNSTTNNGTQTTGNNSSTSPSTTTP